MGLKYVTVDIDEHGMIPEKLEAALSSWNPAVPRPKVR
jgi:DNA-binding transcriptional MocR family regulator